MNVCGPSEPEDLVVFPTTKHSLGLLLGSLAFVVFGAFMVREWATGAMGAVLAATGVAVVSLSGLGFAVGLHRLVAGRPLLVVDSDGIDDRTNLASLGLVRWEEIDRLERRMEHSALRVVPKNLQEVLRRASLPARMLIRAQSRFRSPPISIPLSFLPVPDEDVLRIVEAWYGRPIPVVDSGVLSVASGLVRFSFEEEEIWSFPLDRLRLIAEYTNDNGPWLDDWYFIFVEGDPVRIRRAPVYAGLELLPELSQHTGTPLEHGLSNSTDFASRVIWPVELTDRPLFAFGPEQRGPGVSNRLKDRLMPQVSMELTDEIRAYLGIPRE